MENAQNGKNDIVKDIVSSYGNNFETIKELIPSDQASPKIYLTLVTEQILGRDRNGKLRPIEDSMLLLYHAKKTGLDPLSKQIYGVYRWDSKLGREKMAIQVGIDGFRAIAERTSRYAGSDDIKFEEQAPIAKTAENATQTNTASSKPLKATATVYKINDITGERMPITATARWSEYVQTTKDGSPSGMWSKMPYLMLGKCAEALALRKAFPQELSGLYVAEEMNQADNKIELGLPDKKDATEKKSCPQGESEKTLDNKFKKNDNQDK